MNPELIEIVHGRANPHIDPTLHIWGWEIPVYLFLGGIVAGLMVLLGILELRSGTRPSSRAVRWMPFVSLALISLGMGALFLDLANKLNVFRFYMAFMPTSPMSWGSWILVGVYPALALLGLGGLLPAERKWLGHLPGLRSGLGAWLLKSTLALADRQRPGLLWLGVGLGVALGTYTGLLLGTLAARLPWNSALLGPLFLTSGISTGAAFLLLFHLDDVTRQRLVRWDLAAIGVELFILALMLLGFVSGGATDALAGAALLGGAWTPVFWSLVVIAGLLVPLTLNVLEVRRHLPLTALSPTLVLIGGFALRAVLVGAGQDMGFSSLP